MFNIVGYMAKYVLLSYGYLLFRKTTALGHWASLGSWGFLSFPRIPSAATGVMEPWVAQGPG